MFLLTWTQIPKMTHFRQMEVERSMTTGLKSDAILSFVDRNVSIFATRQAITRYEFQVSQGKL